jgi:hypothetical protein
MPLPPRPSRHNLKDDACASPGPPRRLLASAALTAGSIVIATAPADAAAKQKTLTVTPFTTAVNVALDHGELRLNNLGERHGNSWHRPNDSWVDVFGVTRRFTP